MSEQRESQVEEALGAKVLYWDHDWCFHGRLELTEQGREKWKI